MNTRFDNATIISLLAFTGLAVVAQLYLSIPLLSTLERTFNVSRGAASWFGSAFGFAYAVGFLIFGPLSDRYGRKRVFVPGLFVLAATTLATGFASSFAILILLRVAQGFAAATFAPAALSYLSDVLPPQMRTTGIAFMTTGFLLAGILGQIYAEVLSLAYGWSAVFWVLAALYTLLFILAMRLPAGAPPDASLSALDVYRNMVRLMRNGSLLAAYAAALTLLFTFVAMYSGLGSYLQGSFGVNREQLLFVRLAGVPGMLLSPLAGPFVARFGSKRVIMAALSAAALGLIFEAVSGPLWWVVAASALFVAGIAVAVPALIGFVGNLAGAARGAGIALYTFVLFVGASLGPLAATWLQPLGFAPLYGFLALTLLIATFLLMFTQPRTTPVQMGTRSSQ